MNRAAMLREVRMEAFERIYELWRRRRLVQAQAAGLLKMSERTFRRWVVRYEAEGPAGLRDRRLGRSARRAPREEAAGLEALYRNGHEGWNVRHFYDEVYVGEGGGTRSYTWVKSRLQAAGLVKKGRRKGPHRERRAATGQMLHQDASTNEWVPGERWDLVVTMETKGLFDSLYTDRGSHYWHTPEAGGKVDRDKPGAVRPGHARAGDRDDRGVLAAGAGTQRAAVRDAAGAVATGTGPGGDRRIWTRRTSS